MAQLVYLFIKNEAEYLPTFMSADWEKNEVF